MNTKAKTIATLLAILSISLVTAAEKQRSGEARDGKKGQRSGQECKKGNQDGDRQGRREAVLERFDKNNDGKLSKKERAHAKRAAKKHRQNKADNATT